MKYFFSNLDVSTDVLGLIHANDYEYLDALNISRVHNTLSSINISMKELFFRKSPREPYTK